MRGVIIQQIDGCAQGQMSQGWVVENCLALERLASLRRGGRKASAPTQTKAPALESGGHNIVWDLEENLQAQLHVEGFSGPDAGGAVEVANRVRDFATARTCGA